MTVPFWGNDPFILLNKEYIFQAWPLQTMSFEEKLNAITRFVILLSLLGYIFTRTTNILGVGIITLFLIFVMYKLRKQHAEGMTSNDKEEYIEEKINNFTKETTSKMLSNSEMDRLRNATDVKPPGGNNSMISMGRANGITDEINSEMTSAHGVMINPATLEKFMKSEFETTDKKNPMGNVLLTEINDKPNRKSAPPSFHPTVYEDINNSTKKMVQQLNPKITNTNKQLFGDLGEKFEFDQSMWHYYSNPNTKIANDQGAFAHWLYGNMPSARDGDVQALLQDNVRYNLY